MRRYIIRDITPIQNIFRICCYLLCNLIYRNINLLTFLGLWMVTISELSAKVEAADIGLTLEDV